MELCTWVENDHTGIYQTACGNSFQFIDGTPESNHMKFCPYCGKGNKFYRNQIDRQCGNCGKGYFRHLIGGKQ